MTRSYDDVLDEYIEAARTGADVQPILDANLANAVRLREDLRLTTDLRALATSLPPTDDARREQYASRLRSEIRVRSRSKAAPAARPWLRLPMLAGAAVAVVLLAIGVLGPLSGVVNLTGEADAATIEGIVLDYSNGVLSLQTANGVEDVQVDASATIESEPGVSANPTGFTVGELVRIKAQREAAGVLRAKQILRRQGETLVSWCISHGIACVRAEQQQQARITAVCTQETVACNRLREQLEYMRSQRVLGERFVTLRDRCQAREAVACRELLRVCDQYPLLCKSLPARLRATPTAP